MRTIDSWQLAVGRNRRRRGLLRRLPTVLCLLLTTICLLPSAHAAGAWTMQQSGTLGWLHAVFFLDELRGWAVGGTGVLLSTKDGGRVWRVGSRPTDDVIRDVYFSDEQNGWLVCERNIYDLKTTDEPRTFLLRTRDGGATWNKINVIGKDVDVRLVRALFANERRGWTFGEAGTLYTTRDGGVTWERQAVPTRNLLLGGTFLNADQGWLVGAGATLLQTSDGGETWNAGTLHRFVLDSNKTTDWKRVRFTAASFVNQRRGWAVGAGGRIFTTRDGGRTWAAQVSNTTSDLFDVKFLDEFEGWAVGARGVLLHTVDGGGRWTVEPSGTTHALERLYFVGRKRGWVVGFGGTILTYTPGTVTPPRPVMKVPQ